MQQKSLFKERIKDTIYFSQAKLLLRVLPLVVAEDCFAVKGGTAINFFVRDLPRLSVDIDGTGKLHTVHLKPPVVEIARMDKEKHAEALSKLKVNLV